MDLLKMLNESGADELARIPGIGEDRAQKIVDYREENGDFESISDLKNIPGFSDEMVENIKQGASGIEEEEE